MIHVDRTYLFDCRLSWIDDSGNQAHITVNMTSAESSYLFMFDGEIYKFERHALQNLHTGKYLRPVSTLSPSIRHGRQSRCHQIRHSSTQYDTILPVLITISGESYQVGRYITRDSGVDMYYDAADCVRYLLTFINSPASSQFLRLCSPLVYTRQDDDAETADISIVVNAGAREPNMIPRKICGINGGRMLLTINIDNNIWFTLYDIRNDMDIGNPYLLGPIGVEYGVSFATSNVIQVSIKRRNNLQWRFINLDDGTEYWPS